MESSYQDLHFDKQIILSAGTPSGHTENDVIICNCNIRFLDLKDQYSKTY